MKVNLEYLTDYMKRLSYFHTFQKVWHCNSIIFSEKHGVRDKWLDDVDIILLVPGDDISCTLLVVFNSLGYISSVNNSVNTFVGESGHSWTVASAANMVL